MNVIIVGNGGSLLDSNLGSEIDSFDLVIRMGCFKIKGFERNVGEKVNIWSNGVSLLKLQKHFDNVQGEKLWAMVPPHNIDSRYISNDYIKNWARLMYTDSQPTYEQHKKWFAKLQLENDVAQMSWSTLFNLVSDMNLLRADISGSNTTYKSFIRPTLGICTVYEAINRYKNIHIAGFDFFENGWYWDKSHTYTIYKHNILLEKIWFKKQVNAGIIKTL